MSCSHAGIVPEDPPAKAEDAFQKTSVARDVMKTVTVRGRANRAKTDVAGWMSAINHAPGLTNGDIATVKGKSAREDGA